MKNQFNVKRTLSKENQCLIEVLLVSGVVMGVLIPRFSDPSQGLLCPVYEGTALDRYSDR